jgi:hypothetical protein
VATNLPEQMKNELLLISQEIIRQSEMLLGAVAGSSNDDEKQLATVLNASAVKLAYCLENLSMPQDATEVLIWQHDMRSPISSLLGASGVFLEIEEGATNPYKPVVNTIWELALQAGKQLESFIGGNGAV